MKKFVSLFIIAVCILLTTGCRYSTGGFNTYFWTSTGDVDCHLYIDDVDCGRLPYCSRAPKCNNEKLKQKALFVFLPSGSYEVEVRDKDGNEKYAEQLTLKRRFGSTSISSTSDWESGGARATF